MDLNAFMEQLRAHPEYFQVIAQDGGPPSIVMIDPRTDQQVAQYSVPDVTGYRYSDGFQAQMPTGEGDRISVANPDKRPTVQQLQDMWSRSQLPGSGVSFDQYMKETGAKVDASGRVDQTISKDWGFGGGSIWDAIVDLAPKALALYGGVTGLESLLGGAVGATGSAAPAATGAFDTFGALNSPTGLGASGSVFDAAAAAGSGLSPTNILQAVDGTTSAPTGDLLSQYGGTETPLNLGNGVNVTNDSVIQQIAQGSGDIPAGLSGVGGNAAAITAAAGGTGAIPGITNAAGQIAGLDGTVNLANSAGGALTQATQPSWLSQFLKALGVTNEAGTTTSSPLLQGAGALLSYFQDQNRLGTLNDTLKSAADKADPFASQRGFYQDKLKQSYMDPNFFQNDPVFSGIRRTAMNDVERAAAARGYNNSSNVLQNVGSRINDEGLKYANLYQGQLAQNAGAGVSPAAGAGIQAQGAQLASTTQNSANANIGSFLQQLPGIAKQFGLT